MYPDTQGWVQGAGSPVVFDHVPGGQETCSHRAEHGITMQEENSSVTTGAGGSNMGFAHLTFKPSMQYVPMGHTELLLRKDGSAVSGEL